MDTVTAAPVSFYHRYKATIDGWKKNNREKQREHNKRYKAKTQEKSRLYQIEYRARRKAQLDQSSQ